VIIELIGPAGCGKTTAARHLDRLLRGHTPALLGFEALERLDREIGERHLERLPFRKRMRLLLPLFLRHPRIAIPVMVLALVHGPPYKKRFRRAQRSLGHVLLMLRLRRLMPDMVVVADDGFTQTLWTMLVDSRALRGAWLIRLALASYHAVVEQRGLRFRIDDQTAAARVFGRESPGRFNRNAPDERRHAFGRWLAYHRRLVALLPEAVVAGTIDATGSEQDVARALADAIADLAGGAHTASAPPEMQTGADTILTPQRSP